MAWIEQLSQTFGPGLAEAARAEPAEPFAVHLRRAELSPVLDILKRFGCARGCTVLEIGGGAGWQARDLQRAGYKVRSVDRAVRSGVYPVERYDGHHLPAPDASYDVVFSANALEHIPHIEAFQAEIRRVLKPGGLAIHLIPTPVWRIARTLAHYPHLCRDAVAALSGAHRDADMGGIPASRTTWQAVRHAVVPRRHGEIGNVISETWLFSARRWSALFARHGWQVAELRSSDVFYTGYNLFGSRLSVGVRWVLARLLGSASRIYVLTR